MTSSFTDTSNAGDAVIAQPTDASQTVGESAAKEIVDGSADLTGRVKDYYQARRDGMRDKDTSEILGKQPEIVVDYFYPVSQGQIAMTVAMSEQPSGNGGDRQVDKSAENAGGVDHTTDITFENGARVEKNSAGLVTKITDTDGKETQVKWDDSKNPAKVIEMDMPNGTKLVRDDKDHWTKYGQDDQPIPGMEKIHCDIEVGDRGEILRRYEDHSVIQRPDHTFMTYDKNGKPTDFYSPTKGLLPQEYKINGDGSADHTVELTDTFSKIAEDSVKIKHQDDPNYNPSAKEVRDEMSRIAKANDIHDYNDIPVGKKIHIPAS